MSEWLRLRQFLIAPSFPLRVMSWSAVWAAGRRNDCHGRQWRAALICSPSSDKTLLETRDAVLPKMCPAALMGCWVSIWLHKKTRALILFRKQHSSFTEAFTEWPRKGWESGSFFFFFYKLEYVVVSKDTLNSFTLLACRDICANLI